MGILVVGSVAYDDLETPYGVRKDVLGGAAVHFSAAASFFSSVSIVGIVGGDFDKAHIAFLKSRGIDVSGIKIIPEGKTFRWAGKYFSDINKRETLDTQLGVFANFDPELSADQRKEDFVFLANIHPSLQLKVLDQIAKPKFVAMDTMNLWIDTTREDLQRVIERVDMLFINDEEARLLTGEINIVKAARKIMAWGPKSLIIKRGEYGALLFSGNSIFSAPGMPMEHVKDPTGAGDTFAGGFVGSIAKSGDLSENSMRKAVICGSTMASFQVEDFGLDRLRSLAPNDIDTRLSDFYRLSSFDNRAIFSI